MTSINATVGRPCEKLMLPKVGMPTISCALQARLIVPPRVVQSQDEKNWTIFHYDDCTLLTIYGRKRADNNSVCKFVRDHGTTSSDQFIYYVVIPASYLKLLGKSIFQQSSYFKGLHNSYCTSIKKRLESVFLFSAQNSNTISLSFLIRPEFGN